MDQDVRTEDEHGSFTGDAVAGEGRGFEPRMLLLTVFIIVGAVVLGLFVA